MQGHIFSCSIYKTTIETVSKSLSSKMNHRRNSELLEAFKLFDRDGDGKVMLAYNTYIRFNSIVQKMDISIGTLN